MASIFVPVGHLLLVNVVAMARALINGLRVEVRLHLKARSEVAAKLIMFQIRSVSAVCG